MATAPDQVPLPTPDNSGDGGVRARVTVSPEIPSSDSSSADSPDRGDGDSSAFAALLVALRPVVHSLVRHGLTAAGTAWGLKGLAEDSFVNQAVGLVVAILGFALSNASRLQRAKRDGKGAHP